MEKKLSKFRYESSEFTLGNEKRLYLRFEFEKGFCTKIEFIWLTQVDMEAGIPEWPKWKNHSRRNRKTSILTWQEVA